MLKFRRNLSYVFILALILVVLFGCATTEPKSHIYYPRTQAEIDQSELAAKEAQTILDGIAFVFYIYTGSR